MGRFTSVTWSVCPGTAGQASRNALVKYQRNTFPYCRGTSGQFQRYTQDVEFIDYDRNEEKFLAEIEKLCEMALTKTLEHRESLKNIDLAKSTILKHIFTSESIWGNYHKGIICGLTNDFTQLNDFFQKLLKENHPGEWPNELKNKVNFLIEDADDQNKFTATIIEIIRKARTLKKLPEKEIKLTE